MKASQRVKTKIAFLGSVLALSGITVPAARAAVIAVIDSGTDLSHSMLVKHQWNNVNEHDDGVDNDDDGYIGDVHGWNFADGTNQLYSKKLLGKFSPDVYKFFELQTKALKGVATSDDIAWLKLKEQDKNYIAELEAFGGWVHGTHVAGISSRNADGAQIMPLKVIPTQAAGYFQESSSMDVSSEFLSEPSKPDKREWLVRKGLDLLAQAQGTTFGPIGQYVYDHQAQVANCSFGSSVPALKGTIQPLIELVLGRKLTEAEAESYLSYFIAQSLASMDQNFIQKANHTLFVIAAGNDGTDNDTLPTAPANIRAENTITVAATLGTEKIASFSNYGAQMVDLGAPGVGILSSIPGNSMLQLSGTSQATPFVTNMAGQIWDANPKLSLGEVKRIILETVDVKPWLKNLVRSGGLANPDRAIFAAKLTLQGTVTAAIDQAMQKVPEWHDTTSSASLVWHDTNSDGQKASYVAPLVPLVR